MKRTLVKIGMLFFAGIFCLSAYKILGWYEGSRQNKQAFEQVEAMLNKTEAIGIAGSADEDAEPTILSEYLTIYEQNNDFAGWITIENTEINYPVMQSIEDSDFYLKHNFEKEYSDYGVPYLQSDCDLLKSDNLLIYGHAMNDGSMFADLKKYRDMEFYRAHTQISFDTRYSHGLYEIVAVFTTTANEGGFAYNAFVNAASEAEFDEYIAKCKELSLYEIDTTAQYGDRLITLSTCEYTNSNGRMVVVAKQIDE